MHRTPPSSSRRRRLIAAAGAAGAAGAAVVLRIPAARAQGMTAGEVVKVDRVGGRITVKHAGIRELDMPAMAITLQVRDRRLIEGVAAGDRVRFTAERVDGHYTLTALAKAP